MTNPSYTHLALVVDRSGSMGYIAKDMNGGIAQLLADQAKQPGECHVDITTFDTEVEHPFTNVRPDDIKVPIIHPRGGTALLDALGSTIVKLGETFAAMEEDERPGTVMVVVVTDGAENSSHEWSKEQVAELVRKQTNEFGWVFSFLGANIDSFAVAGGLGFEKAQTMDFGYTSKGASNAAAAMSSNITRSRLGDTTGYVQSERDAASH